MTKKLDPDRPNKARRGRPSKDKRRRNRPDASARMKAYWASPEGRARMQERDKARLEDTKRNPEKYSRYGVPNGMTKAKAAPLWAEARRKADRFINKMEDEGFAPTVVIPDTDEAKGVAALHAAAVLALGPSDKQIKLAAIRTVLEYTKSKPESKSKVTVTAPEQWLADIAADDAGAE